MWPVSFIYAFSCNLKIAQTWRFMCELCSSCLLECHSYKSFSASSANKEIILVGNRCRLIQYSFQSHKRCTCISIHCPFAPFESKRRRRRKQKKKFAFVLCKQLCSNWKAQPSCPRKNAFCASGYLNLRRHFLYLFLWMDLLADDVNRFFLNCNRNFSRTTWRSLSTNSSMKWNLPTLVQFIIAMKI